MRVPDAGAGAASRCACVDRARVPRLLEAAEIPPKYQNCTLDNFQVDLPSEGKGSLRKAREACRDFVRMFGDQKSGERGLLFIGRPGTGKTHLATAVLQDVVRTFNARGRFVDFTSFIARIQATFDPTSEESKHQVLDPVLHADVLVLDELGAQKPTQFVQDTLYLIINSRYNQRKTTIFTTNYHLHSMPAPPVTRSGGEFTTPHSHDLSVDRMQRSDLLSERISAVVVSRIQEMTQTLVLAASDYRTTGRGALAGR